MEGVCQGPPSQSGSPDKDEYLHIFGDLNLETRLRERKEKETLKDGEKGPRVRALASVATLKMFEVISPIR